jgi:epoxyqueuosine reductase
MDIPKAGIREKAKALGFSLCGFTAADPPAGYPRYAAWIQAGFHGGMRYLASPDGLAARADPARLLPSLRTIIALATPYPPPLPDVPPPGGNVAAYALGDDYHRVMKDRLIRLGAELDLLAGHAAKFLAWVDTGPVLEREIASRAGLGWIGRNSMLIHPQLGSFLFLGEIFTDLFLEPDPPFAADRCGRCERCLQACPTGCILPDRTIDSRRCISYLTIEHRGSIPVELRGAIGSRLFGCDICQTVCPWNRKAPPATDPRFIARPIFPITNLQEEIAISQEAWQDRFRDSAVHRTGWAGYRRNAIIALGNTAGTEAEQVLKSLQSEPDPVLRETAAWGLDRIRGNIGKNG